MRILNENSNFIKDYLRILMDTQVKTFKNIFTDIFTYIFRNFDHFEKELSF